MRTKHCCYCCGLLLLEKKKVDLSHRATTESDESQDQDQDTTSTLLSISYAIQYTSSENCNLHFCNAISWISGPSSSCGNSHSIQNQRQLRDSAQALAAGRAGELVVSRTKTAEGNCCNGAVPQACGWQPQLIQRCANRRELQQG